MTDHTRQTLMDAALKVYAEHGFRGATTRRIAEAAQVNEVTLFRLFKSKEALISEAIHAHAAAMDEANALPDEVGDPAVELVAWASREYEGMRFSRAMIRKVFAEMEEHPGLTERVCTAPNHSHGQLLRYINEMASRGLIPEPGEDAAVAASMLMSSLFADAMSRDAMPHMFPQPADEAPAHYVRLFMRALGCPRAGASMRASSPVVFA